MAAQDKLKNSLEFLKTASSTPDIERIFNSVANNIVSQQGVLNEIGAKTSDSLGVTEVIRIAKNQINEAASTTVGIINDMKQRVGIAAVSNLENDIKTIISVIKSGSMPTMNSSSTTVGIIKVVPVAPAQNNEGVFCTMEYDPVCAQPPMPKCPEGMACIQVMPMPKTYSNECVAKNSGATIKYKGECAVSDSLATTTEYSIKCLRYDPVCGIDGKTYGCGEPDAQANGVKIAYTGECQKTTATIPSVGVVSKDVCGQENEKVNRDPLVGPVTKQCCYGLIEDRSNRAFSICIKSLENNTSDTPNTSSGSTGIANPASIFCVSRGYKNIIRNNADGSQYGVCIFNDGSECEEWKYYRGECKEGGSSSLTPSTNTGTVNSVVPSTSNTNPYSY